MKTSCDIHPRAGCKSVHKAASVTFLVRDTKDGLIQDGKYYIHRLPHLCLPDVTNMTRSPRTSPLHLHTANDWRWESGLGTSCGSPSCTPVKVGILPVMLHVYSVLGVTSSASTVIILPPLLSANWHQ